MRAAPGFLEAPPVLGAPHHSRQRIVHVLLGGISAASRPHLDGISRLHLHGISAASLCCISTASRSHLGDSPAGRATSTARCAPTGSTRSRTCTTTPGDVHGTLARAHTPARMRVCLRLTRACVWHVRLTGSTRSRTYMYYHAPASGMPSGGSGRGRRGGRPWRPSSRASARRARPPSPGDCMLH